MWVKTVVPGQLVRLQMITKQETVFWSKYFSFSSQLRKHWNTRGKHQATYSHCEQLITTIAHLGTRETSDIYNLIDNCQIETPRRPQEAT